MLGLNITPAGEGIKISINGQSISPASPIYKESDAVQALNGFELSVGANEEPEQFFEARQQWAL